MFCSYLYTFIEVIHSVWKSARRLRPVEAASRSLSGGNLDADKVNIELVGPQCNVWLNCLFLWAESFSGVDAAASRPSSDAPGLVNFSFNRLILADVTWLLGGSDVCCFLCLFVIWSIRPQTPLYLCFTNYADVDRASEGNLRSKLHTHNLVTW